MIKLRVNQVIRTTGVIVSFALWAGVAQASLIISGDPTTGLTHTLFLDDASTGGGDTSNFTAATSATRTLNLNSAAGVPGAPGTVTLTGFGFATGAAVGAGATSVATSTPALTLQLTFVYLGANQAVGGGDDVTIGSTEAFVFSDGTIGNATGWEGASQYYVNFDTDPTAIIDGLGEVFQITMTPVSGAIRFKTTTGTALTAAKFSFSGTFSAIPEPGAFLFGGLASAVVAATSVVRGNRRR